MIFNTILRGIAVYFLGLLMARLVGRKLVSQMTFFDFVFGVSMGSLVANAIIGPNSSPLSSTAGLITISILSIITAYLHIKSIKIRKLVNSEPVTLVQNGTIVEENMKRTRITLNELMMKLREKNAFSLADVEFAIMETDGQLSVLPMSSKKPLTPSDMNINVSSSGLPKDIIIDGKVMEENLMDAGLDKKWLDEQLRIQKISEYSQVFYAGVDSSKKLFISKKSSESEEPGKYGIE